MEGFEFTGKNIEKAIEKGLSELNKSREEVDIKIISEGGLFSKAKVLITINEEEKEEVLTKTEEVIETKTEEKTEEKCEEGCSCKTCGGDCSCCEEEVYELELEDGELIKAFLLADINLDNKTYRTFEVAEDLKDVVEAGDFLVFEKVCENDEIKLDCVNDEDLIDKIYNEVEKKLSEEECCCEEECSCGEHCDCEECNEEEKPAREYLSSEEVYDKINEIFQTIFKSLNISGRVMILENDDAYEVKVMGDENINALIGYRGEGLNAYQFLINNFLCLRNKAKKIFIDVENYRTKREESLKALAVRIAKKVLKTKRKHKFEPMTPYERHVIHEELSNFKGVTTHSEGNEPFRCLVVDVEK